MESIEDKVSSHGRSFITNLYILLRITGIYDSMNETIVKAAGKFAADLELLLDETGELTVKVIEGSFYLEGIRVKAGVSDVDSFGALAEALQKKALGVIDFRAPVKTEELIRLAYAIKESGELAGVQAVLENELIKGISVGGAVSFQKEEGFDLKDSGEMAKGAYKKALAALYEVDNAIRGGFRTKLKRIKRSLQLIVDCILADESYLLRLTAAGNQEPYYYFHPVNVSILSVALGKRLGLGRVTLRTLALAALFHDIGKAGMPSDILSKKTNFTREELAIVKRHPVDGIKILLRSFGVNESSILSMLVALEHHIKLDHSGYPPYALERDPNLFSRIVSIADDYDSLISGKVYERKRLCREDALRMIYSGAGTLYDPLLAETFLGMFL